MMHLMQTRISGVAIIMLIAILLMYAADVLSAYCSAIAILIILIAIAIICLYSEWKGEPI